MLGLGRPIKVYKTLIVNERKEMVESSVAGKGVILIPSHKGNIESRKVMGDI